MIPTTSVNPKASLAGETYFAGPAVEVEFDQSFVLCTWCGITADGTFRGTAMVLVEGDLLRWTAEPDGAELKQMTILMPTSQGWQPKNLTLLLYVASTSHASTIVVCQDDDGKRFTLWPHEAVPTFRRSPHGQIKE